MTGREFLGLARRYVAGATEADWRSAVGRAYYAAFHVARQFLLDLRFAVPPDQQAHRYLIYRLTNCGDAAAAGAGLKLDDLRRRRNDADYDLAVPLSQQAAVDLVVVAADLIVALDGLTAAQRLAVQSGIRQYEATTLLQVTYRP